MSQVQRQRAAIDHSTKTRMTTQGLQLGAEEQRAARVTVVQRLYAQTISHEVQDAQLSIPHGKREHADEARYSCFDPPSVAGRQQHFAVRATAIHRRHAASVEFSPDPGKIVNFAVEGQRVAAARRGHRLMTRRREIDDGQTTKADRVATGRFAPDAHVIGASVHERVRHPPG
jgi:hypothetical protein